MLDGSFCLRSIDILPAPIKRKTIVALVPNGFSVPSLKSGIQVFLSDIHLLPPNALDEFDEINSGVGNVVLDTVRVVLAIVTTLLTNCSIEFLAKISENLTPPTVGDVLCVLRHGIDVVMLPLLLIPGELN